jgi:hypothetical protein
MVEPRDRFVWRFEPAAAGTAGPHGGELFFHDPQALDVAGRMTQGRRGGQDVDDHQRGQAGDGPLARATSTHRMTERVRPVLEIATTAVPGPARDAAMNCW